VRPLEWVDAELALGRDETDSGEPPELHEWVNGS
jgi:hypothetical protein